MENQSSAAVDGKQIRFKRRAAVLVVAILLLAGGGLFAYLEQRERVAPKYLQLTDGTEAFFRGDTSITSAADFDRTRNLTVDGDALLIVPAHPQPMTIRSRLLKLTVTGHTAIRMTAFWKEAGEQVEVLYGNVTAYKSYESHYSEPDVLVGGQMTMINRDIDLMEKETAELPALCAWSKALVAEVQKGRSFDCEAPT